MVKAKLSNFIKNNELKLKNLGKKILIVAIAVFIATIMLSFTRKKDSSTNSSVNNIYRPTETVIKGSNISEKQFITDKNTVNTFMDLCNSGKINEAYNLLSDECKNYLYPTIDIFKKSYYQIIFKEKREYNLQSWVSTSNYTVYKIRYTNNILSSGIYNENNVLQDYITLVKNKNSNKISIGSFITTENCNVITKTNEIEAQVIKKNIYVEDEEYEIQIKNKTSNLILLDDLKNSNNIQLVGDNESVFNAYTNRIFASDILLNPGETKKVKIKFKKSCSSNKNSKFIQFLKVINNYNNYTNNEKNYNDTFYLKIKV